MTVPCSMPGDPTLPYQISNVRPNNKQRHAADPPHARARRPPRDGGGGARRATGGLQATAPRPLHPSWACAPILSPDQMPDKVRSWDA